MAYIELCIGFLMGDRSEGPYSTRNMTDLYLAHSDVCYGTTQMVVKYSSERLVHIYQTVQHYIPEYGCLNLITSMNISVDFF